MEKKSWAMDALVVFWNMESSAGEKVFPYERCCSVFWGHWVLWHLQGRVALPESLRQMWSDGGKEQIGDFSLNTSMFNHCKLSAFIHRLPEPQQGGRGLRGCGGAGTTMAAGEFSSPLFWLFLIPTGVCSRGFTLAPQWVFPYTWLLGISPSA